MGFISLVPVILDAGLVQSNEAPGTNITGTNDMNPSDALGSASADCHYQVTVIAYKPLADSEQCGGITLSILIVDLNGLSIHIAMVCQGVHKSLPGRIQCGVFRWLDNTDPEFLLPGIRWVRCTGSH